FLAFIGANLCVRPLYRRNNAAYLGRRAITQVRAYKSKKICNNDGMTAGREIRRYRAACGKTFLIL
ncbi:MAG: hypothetical protein ABI370_13470, partial [Gammaproteobacteria bacterium]